LSATLSAIYDNVTSPSERIASGSAYGNLMYDAYNYLAGTTPFASSDDVVAALADSRGYSSSYTRFASPLSAATSCAPAYIIFIGNPNASGPSPDTAANTAALAALGGNTAQLKLPVYTATLQTVSTPLGYSSACYGAPPAGTPVDYPSQCPPASATYDSCAYSTTDTTSVLPACTSGLRYSVLAATATAPPTTLGNTLACYASEAGCSTADYTCPSGAACSCGSPSTAPGLCPHGVRYQVLGNAQRTLEAPTGTFATPAATYNADEWARFLHSVGVPIGSEPGATRQTVSTYTIDVYNAQPNAIQSGLLASMARAGGGKYFAAVNQQAIVNALTAIFAEIQAVNSTFSSAALPISTTNRAQNENQVYIGMFRPDQTDHPRWFGNLKRYQVASFNGYTDLGGADGKPVASSTTGFITPCAVSWWTTDSGSFWYDTGNDLARIFITQASTPGLAWQVSGDDANFAKGTCGNTGTWSDLPDGPTVEKGAAAQVLRQQSGRNVYTVDATTTGAAGLTVLSTLTAISPDAAVNANIVNFIVGQDVTGEIGGVPSSARRPSVHGDIIHSRPLPVDYGNATGVVVYYGAGDGVYRAVSGTTGAELWAFVAPETYPRLQRLLDNSPLNQVPSPTPPGEAALAGTLPKQFYFDGATGQYQNADNSKVWIYPAMRRGGRMLYSFDVTTPVSPSLKWRRGCPHLDDDIGCAAGMSGIGQTWSTPQLASVNGYKVGGVAAPVVIVGGGYDTCEDADTRTPACGSPKGAAAYVLDADTGALLKSFATARSVIADVALVDTDLDGIVDAGYVADTGGSIYRIDFPWSAPDPSSWTITRVAYTNVTPGNSYRKFQFMPSILLYHGQVYVAISSGDREHPLAASYPYTIPVLNRFYVYLDDPLRTTATDLDGPAMLDASATSPTCSSPGVLPGGTALGWHMDLNAFGRGEQGVTSPVIIGGMATFSTNRPVVGGAMCSTALGQARGYWVNLLNGSGAIGVAGTCGGSVSQQFIGGGLPPSPVAATVSVDGKSQSIVVGCVSREDAGPSSAISAQQVRPPISSKRSRSYWHDDGDSR
jgi:type IV pilus assembly protein PilY1